MSNGQQKLTPTQQFEPHQWWFAVTKTVGVPEVADALDVSTKTVYRYRADGVTSARSTSIVERFRHLLAMLCEFDRQDLAVSAVEYLRSGFEDVDPSEPRQLADTMIEEQLLDHRYLGGLHRAIEAGEPVENVRMVATATIAEIQRTVAKYAERR